MLQQKLDGILTPETGTAHMHFKQHSPTIAVHRLHDLTEHPHVSLQCCLKPWVLWLHHNTSQPSKEALDVSPITSASDFSGLHLPGGCRRLTCSTAITATP